MPSPLAEDTLCPIVRVFNEDMKRYWPQYQPQGVVYTTSHYLQLDFVLLTTALEARQFSQFPINLTFHLSCG